MKLKNKLLPLVGVATACAAVAPIATSCKLSTDDGFTDLTSLYKPTIKMYSEEVGNNNALTQAQANKAYFGDAEDGWTDEATLAERFQQDFCWSKSYANYFLNSGQGLDPQPYGSSSVSIHNIKFNYIKIGHEAVYTTIIESHDVSTISFQAEYSYTQDYKWINDDIEWSETDTYEGTITVTNLPVCITQYYNTYASGYVWCVLPYWNEIAAECVQLSTINQIPFTFCNSYKSTYDVTSEGESRKIDDSGETSYYTAYISSGEDETDRREKFDLFNEYWITCGLNFASYYLYGNGVKQ